MIRISAEFLLKADGSITEDLTCRISDVNMSDRILRNVRSEGKLLNKIHHRETYRI